MSKIVELLQELLGSVGNPLGEATYLSIGHLFLGSFLFGYNPYGIKPFIYVVISFLVLLHFFSAYNDIINKNDK